MPDIVDIVVSAIPWFTGLIGMADVVITAIPKFGNIPLYVFIGSAFLILAYWFQYES